ncbi:TetR/AcrR family transcriptional regulator [Isoptericola sp. NPDC056578]|uniref:TetR/AcrR family transcriptional regulator n=1 Tax=Isoptericola sp. NPDC056578 TaxID=3345870 RepID=UPI0036CDFDC1
MTRQAPPPSPRRTELLEAAYCYALEHGLTDLSLRPLAAAVGSSPRVLILLFGSKEGLLRAVLARAREDETALLDHRGDRRGLADAGRHVWEWLADPEHRPLLRLWAESYTRSLGAADGPWHGFARGTVDDWLALLAAHQPAGERESEAGARRRTAILALLRGALLDLLATDDVARVGAAVQAQLALFDDAPAPPAGDARGEA